MTLGLSLTGISSADQTMLFLLGLGSTGKSTVMEICKLSVEDYIFSLPKQTFTKGYSKIDKVLNTYAKRPYIRISHINEPEDTKIDDSLFKDHTDGKIQTTSLYKDGSNDFQHYSKMVFTANTFPNIKIDSGTVRRVDSFTHTSKFTKIPSEVNHKQHIYQDDIDFKKKIEKDEKYLNSFFYILSTYGFNWITKKEIFKQTINFINTKDAIISSNDVMQDYIDKNLIVTNNDKDRISRDEMFESFKIAYPKSFITPTQLLNSLKQKDIIYNGDYRKNHLKGCYAGVRFRDCDEEYIIEDTKSVDMIEKSKYDDLLEQIKFLKDQLNYRESKNIVVIEPIIEKVIEKVIEEEISIDELEKLFPKNKTKLLETVGLEGFASTQAKEYNEIKNKTIKQNWLNAHKILCTLKTTTDISNHMLIIVKKK